MNSIELVRQYQRITTLIKSTMDSTKDNLELQAHWSKYICVLCAGFLENAICEIYINFVDQSSSPPPIAFFSRRNIEKINNPKSQKFITTAYAFKKDWGKELESFFNDNPDKKNAIDSIMNNRHAIAHGQSSSITISRLKEYLKNCIDVIDFLENQCNPKM